MSIKDEIRTAVFSAQAKKKIITFFGKEVELRQMSTGTIMSLKESDDRKSAMVKSIILHCYVPGTNERLFDQTDEDALMDIPFGAEMIKLSEEIGSLSGIDLDMKEDTTVEDEVKNLETAQNDSAST